MKICFLASAASIHSQKWINFFSDLGYDILWISLDSSSVQVEKNITYLEIKGPAFFNIFRVRSLISKFNPDILHVHYLGYYALLGIFSDAKCIVATPWGSDVIEGKKSFFKRFVISQILQKSRLITCDAYHMLEEVSAFNVPSEKINIINFGIDTIKFSNKNIEGNALSSLGVTGKQKIISLRGFEPVYDIESLIKSIPIVVFKFPNVQFVLLGRGSLKEEIRSLVKAMSIDDSVFFLGYVDYDDMPNILSSADVYVSTSLSDAGIAASTAEAMSCELPVVITDSGENSRWVDHGENGFLVPNSDPKELAKCIITLLENIELGRSMGKKARKTITDRNDHNVEMKKMQVLYQKLLQ